MYSYRDKLLMFALALLMGFLALSGISSYDRTTWLLEVFAIFIATPVLVGLTKVFLSRRYYTYAFSCTRSSSCWAARTHMLAY